MSTNEYLSIASLVIALSASLYTYLTNTKKYELSTDYRSEVLKWYSDTVTILIRFREEAKLGFADIVLKKELLSRLSSNIEIGRFYFPNIIKGDKFGDQKPSAYRGYRNNVLEFLVSSYHIFEDGSASTHLDHIEVLQKNFTSSVFDVLDPNGYLKGNQETHQQNVQQRFYTRGLYC